MSDEEHRQKRKQTLTNTNLKCSKPRASLKLLAAPASAPGEFYAVLRAVGSQAVNVYVAGGT